MDLITLDFESFYSKDIGFKKQTTEEYVRDDQFHVIGVAVKVNDEQTQWFSGTHADTKDWLGQFNWREALVLAHNTQFDGAILNWHFGITPKGWLDTLCMARALHGVEAGGSLAKLAERYAIGVKGTEVNDALGKRRIDFASDDLAKYGEYCRNDVDLTHKLFKIFIEAGFPKSELKVIDVTLRMFVEPSLELNLPLLEQHLEDVKNKKEKLLAACVTDKDTLMSNDKFAGLLTKLGVVPPTKISARTGKEAWAFAKTDENFKELASHRTHGYKHLLPQDWELKQLWRRHAPNDSSTSPSVASYLYQLNTTPHTPDVGVGMTRSTYRTYQAVDKRQQAKDVDHCAQRLRCY
jgi:hypothetical protein